MIDPITAGIAGALIAIALTAIVAFYIGKKKGRQEENYRCEHILLVALNTRFSPTAREAAVTITGRQTEEQMKSELHSMNEITRQTVK